ncbi:hypothetical protein LIER_21618 [Lithospermum erythrorhizon]|uniref:Chitin-binding type-1 domain-containing protein n=1 Tax=Lithospermum erythrorhizon TaxID=34254 RepID=A0AAV3QSF0_LITER
MKFHNHGSNTIFFSLLILLLLALTSSGQTPPRAPSPPGSCGGSDLCHDGLCCSIEDFCGNTEDYCAPGHCQSQCWGSAPPPPLPPRPPTSPPPPPPSPPPPAHFPICGIDYFCAVGDCCSPFGFCVPITFGTECVF